MRAARPGRGRSTPPRAGGVASVAVMSDANPDKKIGPDGRPVPTGRLVLLRHGPTEWSESGQHTGSTDLPLTDYGVEVTRATAPMLEPYDFVEVLVSPLQRARHTAELLGLEATAVDENLREWDYGGYEGRTTPEIREELGFGWTIWEDGTVPGNTPGEQIEEVAARARSVIDRVRPTLEAGGDVALVAHGHLLRVLAATWLRENLRFGGSLILDAGSISELGYEHDMPAIKLWNARAKDQPTL